MEYEKKFIIIGNVNAVSYKEIFPLIKDNKLWMGQSIKSGDRKFLVPDDYELNAAGCGIDEDGKKFIRVKGVRTSISRSDTMTFLYTATIRPTSIQRTTTLTPLR